MSGYDHHTPPSATGAPARLTVATCQFGVTHDIGANLAAITDLLRAAAEQGADLVHFPECALSGYGPADWPDWRGFDWDALTGATEALCDAAQAAGVWVAVGSADRAGPTNCVQVIDRRGMVVGRYDKRACSANDRRAFVPGQAPLVLDIEGVRCGVLICLDWGFPEFWAELSGVELVLHSAVSDGHRADRNQTHTIPALMQGYSFLYGYAISVANSARPRQDFPSFWVERSGHRGRECVRDQPGFVLDALADDPEQDRFFAMVRESRAAIRSGIRPASRVGFSPPDRS